MNIIKKFFLSEIYPIQRLKNYFFKYGFFKTIQKILNLFFLKVGFKIERLNYNFERYELERKIFKTKKLKWSDRGYWYLDPMPSEDDLNKYYKSAYWKHGKLYGSLERDFIHWNIIFNYLSNFFIEKKTILNFGAGHGGISNIFWVLGHNIINVEPSMMPNSFEGRWHNYKKIKDVPDSSIDFFYSSHSLEHVADLDDFLKSIRRVLKKKSYIFFEVPNGNCPKNGPLEERIHAPHTYYFKKEFFNKEFKNIILNDCFSDTFGNGDFYNWKNYVDYNGVIIRVLAMNN